MQNIAATHEVAQALCGLKVIAGLELGQPDSTGITCQLFWKFRSHTTSSRERKSAPKQPATARLIIMSDELDELDELLTRL